MSNQIVISSGAKVRSLEGVLTGTAGIVSSVPYGGANGVATLDSSGKVPLSQLPASVITYLGTWNAATNTPTLTNGVGDDGDLYICNVAGTVNFGAGPITFAVGDWVIYGSGTWQKSAGASGTVTSVAVSSTGNDAISITGSPITTSGTINIGFTGTSAQYVNGAGDLTTFPSLTGYVPYTGATADVNLGAFDLYTSKVWLYDNPNSAYGSMELTDGVLHFEDVHGHSMVTMEDGYLTIANSSSIRALLNVSGLTVNRDYTFPNLSGTLALLEGTQTFTGVKNFDVGLTLKDGIYPTPSTGYIGLASNGDGLTILTKSGATVYNHNIQFQASSNDYNFPAITGIMAMLEGSQTFSGAKTFTDNTIFSVSPLFDQSANYKVGASLVGTGNYIAMAFDKSGTGSGSTLSMKLADGTTAKGIILNFVGSPATYTYTFPAISGNVAILEAGNTFTNVNTFTNNIYIDNASPTSANSINFKTTSGGVSYAGAGYMSLFSTTAKSLTIMSTDSLYMAVFGFSSLTASRNFSFPDATGTIALTSDIPSLSGYVPYTGATGAVNLGTNAISASVVNANGNGSNAGQIFMKHGSGFSLTAGYASIGSDTSYNLYFYNTVSAATKSFILNAGSLTTGTTRTYTLPDATGTLALTSDLGNYVTLDTTQTITGAKTFTTNVTKFKDVYVEGSGTSASGVNLKQSSGGVAYAGSGYMTINAFGTKQIGILDGATQTNAYISLNSITSGVSRTYTLPDANGTLVLGTGTTNYLPKFTGASTLGNSLMQENTNAIAVGVTPSSWSGFNALQVSSLGLWSTTANNSHFSSNLYYDGTDRRYITSDYALEYNQQTGVHKWLYAASGTAGAIATMSEAMRITSTGNVGIGTSSPIRRLTVPSDGTNWISGVFGGTGNSDVVVVGNLYGATIGGHNSTLTAWAPLLLNPDGGQVLIGTSTQDSGAKLTIGQGTSVGISFVSTGTGTTGVQYFKNANGVVGQIYTSGSTTTYATSSDYRLKQDLKDYNGLELVSRIKTYDYEWKSDNNRAFGVLAHELQEVIPYAVNGEKDETFEDGETKAQMVDYSKLVPVLVKAVQEQQAQILELSAKVSALENKS
jgi:hypothetical protein